MSKNLVEEYKVQMQADIPDLWARIEASLPEKELKIEEKASCMESKADDSNVVSFDDAKKKVKKTQNKTAKMRKWIYTLSGVAVAGIAMLIVLPFVRDSRIENATQSMVSEEAKVKSGSKKSDKAKEDLYMLGDATAADESSGATGGSFAETINNDIDAYVQDTRDVMTSADMAETEEEVAIDIVYSGVTCELVSVDKSLGKYLYEVRVSACESDEDLIDDTIYIESKSSIFDSEDEIIVDLAFEKDVDGKSIYSIVD